MESSKKQIIYAVCLVILAYGISLLYSIYLQPSVDAWLTLHKLNLIKK